MATTKEKKTDVVEIRPLSIQRTRIRIVGDTPLIVHAWSDKAKLMMLEAQTGKAKGKKKPIRRPADDFIQSAYWLTPKPQYSDKADDEEIMAQYEAAIDAGARFGFPVTAIKQATISAAYRRNWIKNQMGMRGCLFFSGDGNGMVEIHSDPPVMREDMVRIGQGTADLRYRPQFNNWYIDLEIQYDEDCGISWENMMNAINAGGFSCGIGEWRSEKDGDYGRYHIETN